MSVKAPYSARQFFASRSNLRRVVAACLLCAACAADDTNEVSSEQDPGEIASDEEVRDKLAGLGFERSEIEVDGPYVRVDDVTFYRDLVMSGAYGSPAQDTSSPSDKGYRIAVAGVNNPAVSAANQGRINFTFSTRAGEVVSSGHKTAIRRAAADWTLVGSRIRITEGTGSPLITVREISWRNWPAGTACSTNSLACVDAPLNGAPSKNLWIKSEINPFDNPGQCEWSTGSRRQNGFHELGHAIGFHHPKANGSAHIANTTACPNSVETCLFTAGYTTVMTGITYSPGTCDPMVSTLQADDLLSLWRYYP